MAMRAARMLNQPPIAAPRTAAISTISDALQGASRANFSQASIQNSPAFNRGPGTALGSDTEPRKVFTGARGRLRSTDDRIAAHVGASNYILNFCDRVRDFLQLVVKLLKPEIQSVQKLCPCPDPLKIRNWFERFA